MPVAPGFSAVLPGGTMKVGHLYFSGKGRFPGFYDAKGQLFSEFCWKDYDADAVLKTVAQFVEEAPDPMTGFTGAAKGSASFALPEVISAEASASTDAKVSGIKRLTLSASGVTAVLDNLGPKCRADIATYSKTYDIVLLTAAQRADTMTLTAKAKLGLESKVGQLMGLAPIKAGAEADQLLEYKMVYLSGNLGTTEKEGL